MNRKRTMRAFLTVEAAVIIGVSVLLLGTTMQLSLQLYGNISKRCEQEWKPGSIYPSKVLRIKNFGGKEYEKYKLQHPIQEKTE
ncbi:MAG: hypothetical protein E7277_09275 [Lachnospiraceae bacterium]|nr:hypothetical protein [Lachnospiraceae bacterium]